MWIDIIFLLVLAFSFYKGFKKGLIHTVFSSLALIIAIIATLKLSPLVMIKLESLLGVSQMVGFILGVLLVFLFFYITIEFLGKFLEKILKKIRLNFINKISGGFLSAIISLLIIGLIVGFLDDYQLISEVIKEQSFSYSILAPIPEIARSAFASLSPYFKDFWAQANEAFGNLQQGIQNTK